MSHWPVRLRVRQPGGSTIVLRPLHRSDRRAWLNLREQEESWLRPWEATFPGPVGAMLGFGQLRRVLERGARAGHQLPFVIEVDGELAGQMQLFDIAWGSRHTGTAGYWLGRRFTGRGAATWGLALLIDHALGSVGLHRVEVNVRPENRASLAVVRRLGLTEEGLRRQLVHVDGDWRDHLGFAITADQVPAGGLLGQLRQRASD